MQQLSANFTVHSSTQSNVQAHMMRSACTSRPFNGGIYDPGVLQNQAMQRWLTVDKSERPQRWQELLEAAHRQSEVRLLNGQVEVAPFSSWVKSWFAAETSNGSLCHIYCCILWQCSSQRI